MKYPQSYIFLNQTAKLPPLPTVQAWFGGRTAIYVRGVSKPSKVLNERIELLEKLHRYTMKKSDYQMQCVVFCGTAVSELFLIAQTHDLIKVYWVDSADQAKKIKQLSSYINCAMQLDHHIIDVRETYSTLTNYIYSKTGQTLTGDADIEPGLEILLNCGGVRANHQGPRSSDRLKTAAQFFTHANSRFKQALQLLKSKHLRRLASDPEIDRLQRRFDTLQTTCCTLLIRNHVRLPCSKSMFISAFKLLA